MTDLFAAAPSTQVPERKWRGRFFMGGFLTISLMATASWIMLLMWGSTRLIYLL